MPDKQPAQKRHGKGFDEPVDAQGDTYAAPLALDLRQRTEINFDENRDNHDPNQNSYRDIDPGHFDARDVLEGFGPGLPHQDPAHNKNTYPNGQKDPKKT